jgi:hypothetical protein
MLTLCWKAGRWYHKLGIVAGLAFAVAAFTQHQQTGGGWDWLLLMMASVVLLSFGHVGSERCAFREQFREYGEFLQKLPGEPSRLRYLHFLDQLKTNNTVTAQALTRLLPALEARTLYRESFFREHLVLTVLTALLAMLTAAAVAHPVLWSTPLGGQVWIFTAVFWVMALAFSHQWRAVRPTREARERELIAFMHQAAMDLSE